MCERSITLPYAKDMCKGCSNYDMCQNKKMDGVAAIVSTTNTGTPQYISTEQRQALEQSAYNRLVVEQMKAAQQRMAIEAGRYVMGLLK